MEIKVSEIPPEGLGVEFIIGVNDVGEMAEDIKALGPLTASFRLKKVGDTVFITGKVDEKVELICARCGRAFESGISADVNLDLDPVVVLSREEEQELQEGDLEVEFYEDDKIELDELAKEQVLLQVPMKPLCKEGCKGLCQFCGSNLNEGQCGCEPPSGHPGLSGLAGLKELLKKKGEEE
jgi:uncharacterized protein